MVETRLCTQCVHNWVPAIRGQKMPLTACGVYPERRLRDARRECDGKDWAKGNPYESPRP